VYDTSITFGQSYLYHTNMWLSILMHQVVYFTIVCFENSVWFMGDYVFSKMLGPVVDDLLDDYTTRITLPSPFKGQTTEAEFKFDFKNTDAPSIS